jgi:CelD/BcsL family acetyltransferase involved in cellulose biosynthesis
VAVRDVRAASAAQWDAVVDASPLATFFHTREWAELWQRYSGGALRPVARLATLGDGAVALLPAVEKALGDLRFVGRLSPALRTVMSSYGATYGGWVGPGLTAAHHRALWEHTAGLSVDLTSNPFDDAVADAGLPWTRREFTQVVPLPADPDELRRTWSRGHVSAVNKAVRAGLAVTEATAARQWRDYARIYRLSVERWGSADVVHGDELFDDLARSSSGKVRLWLVELDGAAIAGAICFYQGDTVVYWHGALDAAHQKLRPATLLHAQVMRHAAETGHRWYDFCPSGGKEGVIAFKERFGAERRDVGHLVSDAPLKRRLKAALPRR